MANKNILNNKFTFYIVLSIFIFFIAMAIITSNINSKLTDDSNICLDEIRNNSSMDSSINRIHSTLCIDKIKDSWKFKYVSFFYRPNVPSSVSVNHNYENFCTIEVANQFGVADNVWSYCRYS